YNALNEKANQLAHYLRKLGVDVESRIGVALPRSIELIVGLLATLKSGGAYIPLDVEYPPERLAYMLEDSQANFLLTLKTIDLPKNYTGKILYLDEESCYFGQSQKNLGLPQDSESLAYITYTSGSTGRPKGVACHH